ncbi:unnamed protein product [Diamesa tonsa]
MKFIALFPFFCGFILSRELCPNVKIEYVENVNEYPQEEVVYRIVPKDNTSQGIVQDNHDLLFYLHELTLSRTIYILNNKNQSLWCAYSFENIFQFSYMDYAETNAFRGNITCNDKQLIVSRGVFMRTNLNKFMNTFGCDDSPTEEFENMVILLIYENESKVVRCQQRNCLIYPLRFGYMVGLNLDDRNGSEEQKMINFKTKVTNCKKKEPRNDNIFVYILLGSFSLCLTSIVLTKRWLKV